MAFIGNNGASKMCNFDLTTNTNRGSFGISSIGDVATGAQRFNFSANEANAHYTIVASSVGSANGDGMVVASYPGSDEKSTSSFIARANYSTNNDATDITDMQVVVFPNA
mgnify:CR=1 FL=1|tara:strand:- start:590 stop:919 length:330 start_codon:yes stop_codon:yes gene_type:complete